MAEKCKCKNSYELCCGNEKNTNEKHDFKYTMSIEDQKKVDDLTSKAIENNKLADKFRNEERDIYKKYKYKSFSKAWESIIGKTVFFNNAYGIIVGFNMDYAGDISYVRINGFRPFGTFGNKYSDCCSINTFYQMEVSYKNVEFISLETYQHELSKFKNAIISELDERMLFNTSSTDYFKELEINGLDDFEITQSLKGMESPSSR